MMKTKLFLAAWILFFGFSSKAQNDILYLGAEDFDQYDRINISESDQWRFADKTNVQWANGDLVSSEWSDRGPNDFSKTFGANEYIEGWFRLRMQLEESFDTMALKLNVRNFGQALEVFMDGVLIHTIGNLGEEGSEYIRGTPKNLYEFIPVDLSPETVHVLAIHYKYEPVTFPSSLFVNEESLYFACYLTGSKYQPGNADLDLVELAIFLFSSTVIFTIMVLILMLLFQNYRDWFLRLLFICIFGFLIMSVTRLFTIESIYTSYERFNIMSGLGDLAFALILPTLPLIYAKIFTNKLPEKAWLSIPYFAICILEYRILKYGPLGFSLILITFGICVYYIVKSWKHLKGAQWFVVAGGIMFLIVVIIAFILLLNDVEVPVGFFPMLMLVFPLSLLGYVVFRFREIENEVKINADKVIQVTEEKHQQALNQQIKLEVEVDARTSELRQSLESLKAAQSQLIHSEKMASLGELTAGIAHEIQNPLNFVNNFSEVSEEMIEEVNEEIEEGDLDEARSILQDLKGNLEKISHHGHRASSIVKSMLDHSRTSSGEKVATDINALCDEYLRLAYHGMRAKDRSFNSDFKLNLDPFLPRLEVIPQDIGRVLLNLINNAFQACADRTSADLGVSSVSAVTEMQKANSEQRTAPKVIVSTENLGDHIRITVSDNGPGIPDDIKDKIFQPFFTTKPTGQGTGLGLSLSYDIIKAHEGEISVDSSPEHGTTFMITLPMNNTNE